MHYSMIVEWQDLNMPKLHNGEVQMPVKVLNDDGY